MGAGRRPPRRARLCAGELHDLALISFGLALRARGWRIAYLGPDTPMDTLLETTRMLGPQLVVVSATTPQRVSRVSDELRTLAQVAPLVLAGGGPKRALAESVGAGLLEDDPVTEAERVATSRV